MSKAIISWSLFNIVVLFSLADETQLDYDESYCGLFSKVGTDDFRELRIMDGAYVDKSLIVQEYLQAPNGLIVVTRPRQFGKSINAGTIRSFLEIEVDRNGIRLGEASQKNLPLFTGGKIRLDANTTKHYRFLKIARYEYSMKRYGSVPVVYVSFRTVEGNNYTEIRRSVKRVIDSLYESYEYLKRFVLADDPTLESDEKLRLSAYLNKSYNDDEELADSLRFISTIFYKIFCRKTHVIVDDFELAVNNFYERLANERIRDQLSSSAGDQSNRTETVAAILKETFESAELQRVVSFFRRMYKACFDRRNYAVEKVLLSGRMRYAKADVLSGIDNVVHECGLLSANFSAFYGFAQEDVDDTIKSLKCPPQYKSHPIAYYYKGYNIGGRVLYNPWSIVRYFQSGGTLDNFWIDVGSPGFLDYVLTDKKVRKSIEILAAGESILVNRLASSRISFDDNEHVEDDFYNGLYSHLFHGGYLTLINHGSTACQFIDFHNRQSSNVDRQYQLTVPSLELKNIFKERTELMADGRVRAKRKQA